ncbi:MAG: peptidyl-prolyl cis-trans isomerase [Pseudomonadota bacterium]
MTGITQKLFCLLAAFSFSMAGCGLFENAEEGVVLTVGKRVITPEKLKREMRRMSFGVDAAGKDTGEIVESLVNQMIDYYLILEYGSERGIDVSQDELDAAIRDIKKEYSEKDFQETLLQGYVDFDEWKEGLRERLLLQTIIRKVTEGVPAVPFQEIKAYYDSHLDEFKHLEMIKFRQIVRSSREETEEILKRLKGGQDPGGESGGGSKKTGAEGFGEAVWVARGDLEESMEKVIFSLSAGGMSKVVATPYGFHIIHVSARRPEGVKSLPEALPEIEAKLSEERKEAFYQHWLDGLRASIPVEVNHKLLKKLESS